MLLRAIPSSGERLPAIGLGTWQGFDRSVSDVSAMDRLAEALRVFHAGGGRVVDSSPMYGEAERVVGELGDRTRMIGDLFIATKVWTRGEREGIQQMTRSMSLLRRETIDLMQVHNLVDWRTHLATLRRWKDDGKVRYIGVTHYTESAYDELETVIRRERIDFVQFAYSPAVRAAERSLLPVAEERGVAVLVNRPFEGGDAFDHLRARPLPPAIAEWATSWADAFLRFVIAHPAVTCVIPGTGDPAHVAANLAAGDGRLPGPRERDALVRAIRNE